MLAMLMRPYVQIAPPTNYKKNFIIDDRYLDGWVESSSNSITNGTISEGKWISDIYSGGPGPTNGIIKYGKLGVGSFIEVKFQFPQDIVGFHIDMGINSGLYISRITMEMSSYGSPMSEEPYIGYYVFDSNGYPYVYDETLPVFEPYVIRMEILESSIPGKVLIRYFKNGNIKYEHDMDPADIDSMYFRMTPHGSQSLFIDYIDYDFVEYVAPVSYSGSKNFSADNRLLGGWSYTDLYGSVGINTEYSAWWTYYGRCKTWITYPSPMTNATLSANVFLTAFCEYQLKMKSGTNSIVMKLQIENNDTRNFYMKTIIDGIETASQYVRGGDWGYNMRGMCSIVKAGNLIEFKYNGTTINSFSYAENLDTLEIEFAQDQYGWGYAGMDYMSWDVS